MAGEDLQSKSVPIAFKRNSGGLNSSASPIGLQDNESSDLRNIDFDKFGSIKKRQGYTLMNTSDVTVITGTTIAFVNGNPDTITDSGNGFGAVSAGDVVRVTGSTSNDSTSVSNDYTVDTGGAAAGTLTLISSDELTAEAAGATVTVTIVSSNGFNSGASMNSMHWFEQASGTRTLIGTCGDKIWKSDSIASGATLSDITGGLTVTAGDDTIADWVTFRDNAIGTNGVDPVWKWSGTGNAAALTVPTGLTKAKYVETFANYLFLANVTVSATLHPTRIYWSNIGKIETWTATDFNYVSRDDGQAITGLKTLGEQLIIFKERSIHKAIFTGDADIPFVFAKTNSNVGCAGGHTVFEVENGLVFMSQDGLYFFDGNTSTKLSDRINNTINSYNTNRFAFSQGVYQKSKGKYWITFTQSGGSKNSRVITWDTINNAFAEYDEMNINAISMVYQSGGQEQVVFGDYYGYTYIADVEDSFADDEFNQPKAINAYYYTKWLDFEDIVNQKGVSHVYVYYQISASTLTFSYSYNFESGDTYSQTIDLSAGGAVYGTGVYGTAVYGAAGGSTARADITGRGRVIRLKYSNNVIDESFIVDGFGALPHLETNI